MGSVEPRSPMRPRREDGWRRYEQWRSERYEEATAFGLWTEPIGLEQLRRCDRLQQARERWERQSVEERERAALEREWSRRAWEAHIRLVRRSSFREVDDGWIESVRAKVYPAGIPEHEPIDVSLTTIIDAVTDRYGGARRERSFRLEAIVESGCETIDEMPLTLRWQFSGVFHRLERVDL